MKKEIAFYPTPKIIVQKMIDLGKYSKNDKILDSGFGEGIFIKTLQKNNFKNLYGVEYSTNLYNKLKENTNGLNLFNNDYLSFNKINNLDHIIGNPPYINSDNLDKEVKENVRRITNSGEGNIYYAFIIKSIELLKEGGSLNYILPYDFFFNTYASYLRQYLIDNGYFTDIIDLGETKLFKNAAPETIIFKYIKDTSKKHKPKINILKIKGKTNLSNLEENWNAQFNSYKINNFDDNGVWSLSSMKKVKGTKLKDIEGIKISVGIVNGFEEGFILPKDVEKNLTQYEIDKYVRGFIKNSLIPKEYDTNNFIDTYIKYIYIPTNEFKNEEDFKLNVPNIYKHLFKFKELMLKRKLSKNKQWFDYLAIRNIKVFEDNKNQMKIHVPSLTRKENNWFFKTKNDKYVGGDLVTITYKENEKILNKIYKYLNSEAFVKYYKETGARKGKRVVFTQKIISEIVIPNEELN